jgi:hypothetical protein
MPKLTEITPAPAARGDALFYVVDDGASRSAVVRCSTIATMQALAAPLNGSAVEVLDKKRGGLFVFDSGWGASPDGGTTFGAADETTGAWVRQYNGPVHFAWFGPDDTGSTNVATTLQSLIQNHRDVVIDPGTYLCTTGLTLYSNTRVRAHGATINFNTASPNCLIGVDAVTRVDWEGGTMVSVAPLDNQSGLVLRNGAHHNRVILNKIQDFRNKAMDIANASHNNVIQCHDVSGCTGTDGCGVSIFGAFPNDCENNTVLPTYVHNCRAGMTMNGGRYNRFIWPIVVDCSLIGITLDGVVGDGVTGDGDGPKHCYVEHPTVINSASTQFGGIYLGNGASWNTIIAPYSAYNVGSGIRSAGGVGFEPRANLIINPHCEHNGLDGIQMSTGIDTEIVGGRLNNNGRHGLYLFASHGSAMFGGEAYGNTESGVYTQSSNCRFFGTRARGNAYGFRTEFGGGGGANGVFSGCDATGNNVAPMLINAPARVRDCVGFVTESSGTASILEGTNAVTVTHGLGYTPLSRDIQVTPITNPVGLAAWWASGITSTEFVINSANVATQNTGFAWLARRTI